MGELLYLQHGVVCLYLMLFYETAHLTCTDYQRYFRSTGGNYAPREDEPCPSLQMSSLQEVAAQVKFYIKNLLLLFSQSQTANKKILITVTSSPKKFRKFFNNLNSLNFKDQFVDDKETTNCRGVCTVYVILQYVHRFQTKIEKCSYAGCQTLFHLVKMGVTNAVLLEKARLTAGIYLLLLFFVGT